MRVKDARAIINSKKRAQQFRNQNLNNGRTHITDARQILKSRQKRNTIKSKVRAQSIPAAFVKKELGQVLKSVTDYKVPHRTKNTFGKRVEFATGGLITITSKGPGSAKTNPNQHLKRHSLSSEKVSANSRKSVVIRPNQNVQSLQHVLINQQMEVDQEDELESTTLDDFPEIKALPRGLSSLRSASRNPLIQRTQWKPGFSSIATHTKVPVNTMVADEEESLNISTPRQGDNAVFVSNLHESVTQEDIVELFGDVGPLANAQLLQPGSAFVVYLTKAEASYACDTYHNRLLDGQPMQCSLVQPSVSSSRSSLSSRLGGKLITGSRVVPTPSAPVPTYFPTPSFQLPSVSTQAKSGQRSVQFTVKLP